MKEGEGRREGKGGRAGRVGSRGRKEDKKRYCTKSQSFVNHYHTSMKGKAKPIAKLVSQLTIVAMETANGRASC